MISTGFFYIEDGEERYISSYQLPLLHDGVRVTVVIRATRIGGPGGDYASEKVSGTVDRVELSHDPRKYPDDPSSHTFQNVWLTDSVVIEDPRLYGGK